MRIHLAMLPRLHADAQLDAFRAAVVARSMRIAPEEAQRWTRDLERTVDGVTETPRAAPATPEALAAMGIAVVMEGAGMEEADG